MAAVYCLREQKGNNQDRGVATGGNLQDAREPERAECSCFLRGRRQVGRTHSIGRRLFRLAIGISQFNRQASGDQKRFPARPTRGKLFSIQIYSLGLKEARRHVG